VLVAIRPGYANMLDPWRPLWFRLAVVALTATVVLLWYGLLRDRIGGRALNAGGLAVLALLGLVLAAVAPGGSYLTALPALAGAGAGIAELFIDAPPARAAVLTAGGAVAVLILAPTAALFFPALGMATAGAGAFVVALLGLALLPRRLPWTGPAALRAVLTVALAAVGLAADRFDRAHPAPAQLMYALDTDTGQARWLSTEARPGAWTRQYVRDREDVSGTFPIFSGPLATGPAPAAVLAPPEVTPVSDTWAGGRRTLTVRLRPQRPARLVYLEVVSARRVTSATVAGREVPVRDGHFAVLFHAPPVQGVEVRLVFRGSGAVRLRAIDGSDGLAGLPGFHPRPPDVGVQGSHTSELVLVSRTYELPAA
jgi:hypothetical protein